MCTQEDQSSDPSTHLKKKKAGLLPVTPSTRAAETSRCLELTAYAGSSGGGAAEASTGLGSPIAQVGTSGSPAHGQLEWSPPWSALAASGINCGDRVQVTRERRVTSGCIQQTA